MRVEDSLANRHEGFDQPVGLRDGPLIFPEARWCEKSWCMIQGLTLGVNIVGMGSERR